MGLKAGHVDDFDDSLAEAIEQAMKDEWQRAKDEPMPDTDPTDRRILFVAVARGLLAFLNGRPNDVLSTITLQVGPNTSTFPVVAVDVDAEL